MGEGNIKVVKGRDGDEMAEDEWKEGKEREGMIERRHCMIHTEKLR